MMQPTCGTTRLESQGPDDRTIRLRTLPGQLPELGSLVCHIPGLKVVMPSTPTMQGLMKAAIRDGNQSSFSNTCTVPRGSGGGPGRGLHRAHRVAEVKRPGKDVTVVAAALMMHRTLNVAKS
jgi:pyruvate dehydrogenase E1 component beta subunit